ncbi:MAG: histidine phosphatase family protein [Pirellula sp.]|jgi:2,3-bisphosphoglycerate-dependent phosphoglycerate mutase
MSDWQLILIRHAQSENNAKDEAERVPDPGITELGHEQAKHLIPCFHRLAPELVYCSPFLRTIQTLRPAIDSLGMAPVIHPEIYEQGGCYAGHLVGQREPRPGMSRKEIADLCPGWIIHPDISDVGWNRLKQYETIIEARERARQVHEWYELESEIHSHRKVVMMIHADFKLRLLEAFLGIADLDPHLADPYNTSITWLTRNNGKWRLRLWNDHSHLPESHLTT